MIIKFQSARIPGITLNLAGDDYVVPPVTLGVLERMKDQIATFNGNAMDSAQITTVIDLATAALRRNYPDITREQVADIVDIGNMSDVFGSIMDVSGIKRKSQEAATSGEAKPVDQSQTSLQPSVDTPAGPGTT